MATIAFDKRYHIYSVRFRFGGKYYQRSLKGFTKRQAEATRARVEETVSLIQRGRIEMPTDVDPGNFILSDGKVTRAKSKPSLSRKQLFEVYRSSWPEGAKEASTLKLERLHEKHLTRHLGSRKPVQAIGKAEAQQYINNRLKDKYRGKPIRPTTVKKEVATLRLVWNWAFDQGHVPNNPPTTGLKYPREDEKPPFMTFDEIRHHVERVTDKQEASALWESLYLDKSETADVLETIRANARCDYIYPMVAIAAHTGARRSEILRSRREDIDFQRGAITLREKKRTHKKAITFRRVEMTPFLERVLSDWFSHSGTNPVFTIAGADELNPVTADAAHHQLKAALADSRWSVIRGFHVCRHSFVSQLATAGVDQRIIDEFTGHQSDAMRKRYRHLFPHVRKQAILALVNPTQKSATTTA